jgi:hypothetical protein
MSVSTDREQALLAKIRDLSDERVAEIEDFVDFIRSRDIKPKPEKAGRAMSESDEDAGARLDRMYEQFVKPVEHEHLGEYVEVTPTGEMYFAQTESELIKKTMHLREGGNGLFKVGEVAATKIL